MNAAEFTHEEKSASDKKREKRMEKKRHNN